MLDIAVFIMLVIFSYILSEIWIKQLEKKKKNLTALEYAWCVVLPTLPSSFLFLLLLMHQWPVQDAVTMI